jgi:hypothetical protein
MKRILLALAFFALLLPAARNATAAEVSVDFFYNNLSGGQWIEVADYGYGWQPDVAISDPNWRPYTDGYWAYTDLGWTWIAYEDFGWATYHYGRWARLADYGWVWFPGSDLDWGPAWVSWRVGGDYVGWAPLPPRGPGIVYGGEALVGPSVDIEFDIGPAYYNFIDVRYIGEPVLRDRIFAPTQNVTYINQTVNVTNITYNNNTVYNYGPDYNTLSAQSSRPIQRLAVERQSVDPTTAVKSGSVTKVQGDKLVIAAPPKIQKPAKPVAPPTVKTKIAQAKIEKGWTGVTDADRLKQKIKTENPKQIPPPTRATAVGTAAAQASPAMTASPAATAATAATAVAPVERGKARGKAGQRAAAAATASPRPPVSGAVTSPSPAALGKHGRGRAGEQLGATPAAGVAATAAPAATTPPQESPAKRKGEFERATPAAPTGRPGASPRQAPPRRPQGPPPSATPLTGAGQTLQERGPGERPPERAAAPTEMRPSPGQRGAGAEHAEREPATQRVPSAERAEHGPAAQRGPDADRGERGPAGSPGRTEGGKKKAGPSPSPSP